MKFPRRQRDPVEVNLTPLIDVVFLLLIFFMVSTTFTPRQALELSLPAGDHAARLESSPVTLVVTRDGSYRLEAQALATRQALDRALTQHADAAREHGLVIEADGRATHAAVVAALDQAAALNIRQVRIATRPSAASQPQTETP